MTGQQRCRQFSSTPGSAPDGAGRQSSTAPESYTGLGRMPARPAIPDPRCSVPETPRPNNDRVQPTTSASSFRHPPGAGTAKGFSVDTRMDRPAHAVSPLCISTPRGRFGVLVAGAPTSPTVICLAGLMGSANDYAAVLPLIAARGYHAVAVDQRGHARTALMQGTEGEDDVRLRGLAADVHAIRRALGCERVHLVGHSMGGLVAQVAVLADPGPFATLALIDSGPSAVEGPSADELRLLHYALSKWDPDTVWENVRAHRAKELSGARPPVGNAEHESFLRERFFATSPRAMRVAIEELLAAPNRTAELHRLGLKILVAHGEFERYWEPGRQRDMAERLNAELVVISDAVHCPLVENPAPTAAALVNFWDRTTPYGMTSAA
jgi:pimeloyl-ACP methyl ester carboxylesterase